MLKWDLLKRGVDDAAIEEEFKKWEVLQLDREKRLQALQEQKKREMEKSSFQNLDDYLNSLEMVLEIHPMEDSEIPRVSQLTQKTNQFLQYRLHWRVPDDDQSLQVLDVVGDSQQAGEQQ